MKIVIVSDIHANMDAWLAFPEKEWDELWILGDLVNFGPEPAEVIESVRSSNIIVMGNHDFAVAHSDDSHWGPKYREVSSAIREFTSNSLSSEQLQFLADLPTFVRTERDGKRFYIVHSLPTNPLYGRLHEDSADWEKEIAYIESDILLTGHTHIPFIREINGKLIVNPGSIGQPRNGSQRASYAVWENGKISLKSYDYNVQVTIKKIQSLNLPEYVKDSIKNILITSTK